MSIEKEVSQGFLSWAKGQPFNNVLCLLQLAMMGTAVWFALTKLVPAEREAITTFGADLEAHHTKQVERISQTYEKMLDRVSRKEPEKDGVIVGK